ncbi:MAG TPA: pitrilysin family protein [Candidatus Binataceae bacterium]|nr:pitrilysin family protein [Candidatus Binataceae bacterium]
MSRRVSSGGVLLAAAASIIATVAIAPRAHALEIKRMKLSNGAVLLVSEEHQLPMVTVSIAFDAGARRDPAGKAGLAALTARCLGQGTKELSAAEFNQQVDFMGSSVGVSASRDYAGAGFTSLKKYQAQTLALLAGILTRPGLRDADIERKRAQTVADIHSQEEEPGYAASVTFVQDLFGDSPYGHPTDGTAESVAKLTPADVRAFYHDYYKLGGAVIAVTGEVRADEVKASLEKTLSGLAGLVPAQPVPPAPPAPRGLDAKLIDRSVQQANIIMGFGGIARSNPDFYKLQVMNYIFGGGGFASRLVQIVRSEHGLAYSVGSAVDAGKFAGAYGVRLQTKNSSANEAIKLILEQMHAIQEHPVTAAELDGAKKFLIGSFPLKFDRQSAIAGFMLDIELNHLGLDYADRYPKLIGAVTAQDVQAMARKYLHPDAVLLVAVANLKDAAINTAMLSQVAARTSGTADSAK